MSVIEDVPAEVESYLAAVRATLSDLPASERDDLLAEVEASLREAAAEGGAIGARLGSPEEFAAELRSAAGLHEAPAVRSRRLLRETLSRAASHPRVEALRRIARELAPVWWVARAYAVVAGLVVLTDGNWSTRHPSVPHVGNARVGVALIILTGIASVALGLRSRTVRGNLQRAIIAANLVCVVLAVTALGHLSASALPPPTVVTVAEPLAQSGLSYNGSPVQNIYPYTIAGKLLHDVLLYDGAGNPLDIGGNVPDPTRRVLRTTSNESIFNSFPIRYYEPGTVRVAHPNAGPPVRTPHVLPPP